MPGRVGGGSEARYQQSAEEAWADDEARGGLEQFHSQLGTGHAAEGLAGTLAALRDGQASDVLIADDPSSTARA